MKRWSVLLILIITVGISTRIHPANNDVSALEPVELMYVTTQNGIYYLSTDTGQQGRGNTVANAIANLKAVSGKKIFLNTAEHLLVSPSALEAVDRISAYLRPDCSLTVAQGIPDPRQAAPFLDAHKPEFTLNDYRAGDRDIPVLHCQEGEMRLDKP